jgi:hypothetical protein
MDCYDRNPVQKKMMTSNTIETRQALATESTSTKRKPAANKANAAKKTKSAKQQVIKTKTELANKKAEVIALMKRAKVQHWPVSASFRPHTFGTVA